MSAAVVARIRMYRLNELGDCFLVTFTSGNDRTDLLVDCGSFRNDPKAVKRLDEITANIKQELNGKPLDVVVGTHQHNDHVSGFVHFKKRFEKEIKIERVWLSWLDNPADKVAEGIGEAHRNLRRRLALAHARVGGAARGVRASRALRILGDVLGFYGARSNGGPPELPAQGIAILEKIGRQRPLYLKPGKTLELPGMSPGSVRVHVLGPPRKEELLYRKDPRKGESYDHALAAAERLVDKFLDAVEARHGRGSAHEQHFPFGESTKRRGPNSGNDDLKKLRNHYERRTKRWRTIDEDWLDQAEAMALYLDTYTNNSSLVLAIELVASAKVLLFVADAQTGNWLSWKDVKWEKTGVSTDDLLSRTVFYKVGHHASHNATLASAFEKMPTSELAAFIPVHKQDPNIRKQDGWKMPAKNLLKRLIERTENRVLQMDDKNPPSCIPDKDPARKSWRKIGIAPKITPLYVEVEIKG